MFAALSFVFLFLYVVSSLHNTANETITKNKTDKIEKDYTTKLDNVVDTYEQRIKSYESVALENLKNPKHEDSKLDLYKNLANKVESFEDTKLKEINKAKEKIKKEMFRIINSPLQTHTAEYKKIEIDKETIEELKSLGYM